MVKRHSLVVVARAMSMWSCVEREVWRNSIVGVAPHLLNERMFDRPTIGEAASGISCVVVDKDTPGLSFGKKEHKVRGNCLRVTWLRA
jgi:hypothetical protein